jgi:hypothetical protein
MSAETAQEAKSEILRFLDIHDVLFVQLAKPKIAINEETSCPRLQSSKEPCIYLFNVSFSGCLNAYIQEYI